MKQCQLLLIVLFMLISSEDTLTTDSCLADDVNNVIFDEVSVINDVWHFNIIVTIRIKT